MLIFAVQAEGKLPRIAEQVPSKQIAPDACPLHWKRLSVGKFAVRLLEIRAGGLLEECESPDGNNNTGLWNTREELKSNPGIFFEFSQRAHLQITADKRFAQQAVDKQTERFKGANLICSRTRLDLSR